MPLVDQIGKRSSNPGQRAVTPRQAAKTADTADKEELSSGYPELLNSREAAKILHTTVGGLAKRRCNQPDWGPRRYLIGGRIFYDAADTRRFIESCRVLKRDEK